MAMARKGRRQIVVDGVTYFWRSAVDRDMTGVDIVIVDGDNPRSAIRFAVPYELFPLHDRYWWEQVGHWTITPRMIERAIKLKRAREDRRFDSRDLAEVLGIADELERDYLVRATAALGKDAYAFARAFIGVGCTQLEPARVDDWIASHANELVTWRSALQSIVDNIAIDRHYARRAYEHRSAIAFFLEACTRVEVDVGLDLAIVDAGLATTARFHRLPWGIPATHWWWVGGPSGSMLSSEANVGS